MNRAPENQRKALGKGLSALLPTRPAKVEERTAREPAAGSIAQIPIDQIVPNRLQPRNVFDAERLAELAQSIRTHGILQPLIVRRVHNKYELVAGERRLRAAKVAGLDHIPAIVQDLADDHLLEVSLIENIQREDLNPLEVAQAFDRLTRELKLSHEEIGQRTGKDRTTITNMLRLLRLPPDVQLLVAERRLSMGHAKAILALPTPDSQRHLAEKTASQGLSVRQVERLVHKMTQTREPKTVEEASQDPNVKAALQEMERVLGTRVHIVERSEQRGKIEIEYYSQEDLQRIYLLIVGDHQGP
jgi:ParB family chromosome partitioning protein